MELISRFCNFWYQVVLAYSRPYRHLIVCNDAVEMIAVQA